MNKTYRSSKHYRERAEECRTLASWMPHEEPRRGMLKVAEDYDKMAETADWIADHTNEGKGHKL